MNAFEHPYGSARLAERDEVFDAFRDPGGMPFGFMGRRMLTHSTSAGALLISGAGAGKFTTVLSHMLAATGRGSRRRFFLGLRRAARKAVRMAIVDPKGELAAVIGPGLIHRGAKVYTINPFALHGLPNHRINLWAHLVPDSPSLVADCRNAARLLIALSGGGDSRFFEQKAQNWLEALIRGLVTLDGEVSYLRLFELIGLIRSSLEAWETLAATMATRGAPDLRSTYAEMLFMARESERTSASVMGEITNALALFSDPRLQDSFVGSSAADFSLDVLSDDSDQDVFVFFVMPAELMAQYAFLARQFFSTIRILKQRKPGAPVIDLCCDEASLLGHYEDAATLYTAGRGFGLSPFFVYQSLSQIERNLGHSGVSTLLASSDLQIFLGGGISDLKTAEHLSRQMGQQTLHLPDPLVQERAARARDELTHDVLFEGADPVRAGLAMNALEREESHERKMARALFTPDEIIGLDRNKALIFAPGYLPDPFLADKVPYYALRHYAGRFFPNPYFDKDLTQVRVPTRLGMRKRRVIREAVPAAFSEFPQYQSGEWAFIEGYQPKPQI